MSAQNPSRRTLVKGAAWSVPVVAVSSATPAFAASPCRVTLAARCEVVGTRAVLTVSYTASAPLPSSLAFTISPVTEIGSPTVLAPNTTFNATTGVVTVNTVTTGGPLISFRKATTGNDPVSYTISTTQCGGATVTACIRRDTCTC